MTLREEYRRLHRRRRRLIRANYARTVDWSRWDPRDNLTASERLSLATAERRLDRLEMLMHYGNARGQ